jgi:hypothetical protein
VSYIDIGIGFIAGAAVIAGLTYLYNRYTNTGKSLWDVESDEATGEPKAIRYTCPDCGRVIEVPAVTRWIGDFPITFPADDIKCNCCNESTD